MYSQHENIQYMYIVGKYKMYLQLGQKQIERRSSCELFQHISRRVYAHNFYYYRKCTYNVSNLQFQNVQNTSEILLKRAETSIARIVVFNGFLYHDRATLLPFYTVRSSSVKHPDILYQTNKAEKYSHTVIILTNVLLTQ